MPTAPFAINWVLYCLPLAELFVCALMWFALVVRRQPGGSAPFLTAFGGVWIALVVIDFAAVTQLTPTMSWAMSPLALGLFYPHIYLIGGVLLLRLLMRRNTPGQSPLYAGAVAVLQVLGLGWTEFLRLVVASVAAD